MIDFDNEIPVLRQCELLGLPRSTLYYQPRPESSENLELMRAIDQEYGVSQAECRVGIHNLILFQSPA